MATLSATGQDKIKQGFDPLLPGFVHVPFNDLAAVEAAITPKTVAVQIEGIQGEGGVFVASPEYLLGLRALTQKHDLLLLWDGVQDGFFRTGRWQSYERILENVPGAENFLPDAIAMAKSLGAGYPIGAVWIREPYQNVFTPGSHGTTYGGSPLACAVALTVMDVVEREKLADNIRARGEELKRGLEALIGTRGIQEIRGYGGLIGMVVADEPAAWSRGWRKPDSSSFRPPTTRSASSRRSMSPRKRSPRRCGSSKNRSKRKTTAHRPAQTCSLFRCPEIDSIILHPPRTGNDPPSSQMNLGTRKNNSPFLD